MARGIDCCSQQPGSAGLTAATGDCIFSISNTRSHLPRCCGPQGYAYSRCMEQHSDEHTFIGFLDIDEFLVIKDSQVWRGCESTKLHECSITLMATTHLRPPSWAGAILVVPMQ